MKTGTFVLVLGVAVVTGTVVAMAFQGSTPPRTPQEALQRVKLQTGLFWAQAQQAIAQRAAAVQPSVSTTPQATPPSTQPGGFSQAAAVAQAKVEQQARIQEAEATQMRQMASQMGAGEQATVNKLADIFEQQADMAKHRAQSLGQTADVVEER